MNDRTRPRNIRRGGNYKTPLNLKSPPLILKHFDFSLCLETKCLEVKKKKKKTGNKANKRGKSREGKKTENLLSPSAEGT